MKITEITHSPNWQTAGHKDTMHHSNKPIILVLGKICAGKGTYCQSFPEKKHITVSDIVKKVSGVRSRSDLQQTSQFDYLIADELIEKIRFYLDEQDVIVDGIRQLSIIRAIVKEFGKENVDVIWLEVPTEERKRRFETRKRQRDDVPFEQADIRDTSLGLGDVENWAKQYGQVIPNY